MSAEPLETGVVGLYLNASSPTLHVGTVQPDRVAPAARVGEANVDGLAGPAQCHRGGALLAIHFPHDAGHDRQRLAEGVLGAIPTVEGSGSVANYASAAQTASKTDVSPSTNASRNGCCPARNSSVPSAPNTTRPVLRRTFWFVTGSV